MHRRTDRAAPGKSLAGALLLLAACGSSSGDAADADPGAQTDADPSARIDGGPSCEFNGAGDCAICVLEKCADLLEVCQQDADCSCVADCFGQNGVPGVDACLIGQGLTQRPAGFGALEECVAVACPDSDECSTPAGWTPPGDVVCEGSSAGIGSGSLADCSFDGGLTYDPNGTILQLESADQQVCARVERRNDGAGTLANTNWTLLDLLVGPLGEVAHVDADADLCWYSSHHNFRDWAHAWSGTRHYDLVLKEDGHGGPRTYELYVFEEGPLDGATCAATAEGTQCIDGIELFPVNP